MRRSVLAVMVAGAIGMLVVGCSKEQPAPAAQGGTKMPAATKPAGPPPSGADIAAKEKDALVSGATTMLGSMQKQTADLQAAAEKKGSQAKTDYEQNIKPDLDKRLADLKSALDKAKAATGADWASARDALTKAMGDLQAAYHGALQKVTP